jgi:hypothetical protein
VDGGVLAVIRFCLMTTEQAVTTLIAKRYVYRFFHSYACADLSDWV